MNYFYFVINGRAQTICADKSELANLINQFGTCYPTLPEARAEAERLKSEDFNKPKHYSDEERKTLEREQIEFGRSKMTEMEKAQAKQKRKSIDQLQWEFAMQMMGIRKFA